MVAIASRESWGAAPGHADNPLDVPVSDVFVHHEGGGIRPATMTVAQEAAAMREIQGYAMSHGYSDFPYGVGVFGSGRAYEGRDLGFVNGGTTEEEAATAAHNATSIAVVWVGNYQTQTPTDAQIQTTAEVIQLAHLAGTVSWPPNIEGHRDVYSTACPGNNAYLKLPDLRRRTLAVVAVPGKVAPMFNPPLDHVVDILANTLGSWALRRDGAIYTKSGGYYGGALGKSYFVGRTAARLVNPGQAVPGGKPPPAGERGAYVIVANTGERYAYPGP
jgi:hypothetical protein